LTQHHPEGLTGTSRSGLLTFAGQPFEMAQARHWWRSSAGARSMTDLRHLAGFGPT
jgi:hypothetical protein